jgi:hypothetical protein
MSILLKRRQESACLVVGEIALEVSERRLTLGSERFDGVLHVLAMSDDAKTSGVENEHGHPANLLKMCELARRKFDGAFEQDRRAFRDIPQNDGRPPENGSVI